VLRPAVQPGGAAAVEGEPELGGNVGLLAHRCQGLAEKLLVAERAVHLSGVEEGDAEVDGGADEGDADEVVGGPSGLVLLPDPAASRRLVAHRRDPPGHQPGQDSASLGRDQLHHPPTRRIRCFGVTRASPRGKAVAFLGVQLAVFGLYMGSSFAPNHIGMPLVSPTLKLDFLRRQVLMSRNISGGPLISVFMGGLNYQIEQHLFPQWWSKGGKTHA
jgi:hypothetical protein